MNDLQVRIIEDFNEFISLEQKWDSLVDSMEYSMPFLTHSWTRIWIESFGYSNSLYIITVWDDEKLVGILHLYKATYTVLKMFKFPCLRSLSGDQAAAFNIICKMDTLTPVFNSIKDYLANTFHLWSLITLEYVPYDFGTVNGFINRLNDSNMSAFIHPTTKEGLEWSYYIDIKGSFEEYFNRLNRHFRDNRKNRNNKMLRKGMVEFKIIDTYDAKALNLFYDLENTGWKKQKGYPVKASQIKTNFYNNIAKAFSEKKQFLLSTLYIDKKPIASDYGLLFKETFYTLKIGANYSYPEYKKISPGDAIYFQLIKYCFDHKIKRFDFYGACYPYESHWTKTINRKYNIMIFNCKKPLVKLCIILKKIVESLRIIKSKINFIQRHYKLTQQTKH